MADNELLRVLLAHDRWATQQVLDACAGLSDDDFNRRFEIGRGSLHDTLAHMISAIVAWTETLAGQSSGPRMDADGQRRSVDQLREAMRAAYDAFAAEAGRQPLEESVTRQLRDGRTISMARAAVAAHVTTHSMHHRAQCLNMLRHLGKPVPPSGVAEWVMSNKAG